MDVYIKEGKTLPYKILNKNNKHTYFRMRSDHLEISKSKKLNKEAVLKLIDLNFDKFYKKYAIVKNNTLPANEIMLEGRVLNIIKDDINNIAILKDVVFVNENYDYGDKLKLKIYEHHLTNMLRNIDSQVLKVLRKNNIKPRPIRFGYYKSKFGSYHRINDEITLNLVLAKLDIKYLYYVLMHEYAHTEVFNHSKKFYDLLYKMMPEYKIYDKKLKKIAIFV